MIEKSGRFFSLQNIDLRSTQIYDIRNLKYKSQKCFLYPPYNGSRKYPGKNRTKAAPQLERSNSLSLGFYETRLLCSHDSEEEELATQRYQI